MPEALLDVVDECVSNGRRRSEIAAFLAREYGLDAGSITRLLAAHGARTAGRARSAADRRGLPPLDRYAPVA